MPIEMKSMFDVFSVRFIVGFGAYSEMFINGKTDSFCYFSAVQWIFKEIYISGGK